MAIIGKLKSVGPGDFWSDLRGTIRTLNFRADVRIEADRSTPMNADAPTHRVHVKNDDGEYTEIGAAWTKQITRGHSTGESFLSVTLDDPSFAHPLNFSVFKDGEHANATWRRRQEQSA